MEHSPPVTAPRQMTIALDSAVLRGLSLLQRSTTVTILAQLLLEGSARAPEEVADEQS